MPSPAQQKGETRPWFKLWARDFLGSPKFAKMNAAERGTYLTMLLRSWVEDGLALDEEDLADELELEPADLSAMLTGRVGRCFKKDDAGRWRNARLEEEREEAVRVRETARKNGKSGGRPKNPAGSQSEPSGNPVGCKVEPSGNPVGTQNNQEVTGRNRTEPDGTNAVSASVSASVVDTPQSPDTSPVTEGGNARGARKRRKRLSPDELEAMCSMHTLGTATVAAAKEWLAYRAEVPLRSLTNAGWEKMLLKAAKDEPAFRDSVENSIRNGYQGLWPPKGDGSSGSGPTTGRVAVQRANAAAGRECAANASSGAPALPDGAFETPWAKHVREAKKPRVIDAAGGAA